MLSAGDQEEVELPGDQQIASSVHYTTICKHSLVLLRMGEIIARNMLSWLKSLIIKLLLLHLVGCLYYCNIFLCLLNLIFLLCLSHSLLLLQRVKKINFMLVTKDEDRKLKHEIIYSPLQKLTPFLIFGCFLFKNPHPHLFTLSCNFFCSDV